MKVRSPRDLMENRNRKNVANCLCDSLFYRGPIVRRARLTVYALQGVSFYECLRCVDRYVKNDMISGNPVIHAASPQAAAWLAGYKTAEEHNAALALARAKKQEKTCE